jgi:MFS family permease
MSSGLGITLWQVIIGRVIAGIGGAGMNAMISVIITGMLADCLLPHCAPLHLVSFSVGDPFIHPVRLSSGIIRLLISSTLHHARLHHP